MNDAEFRSRYEQLGIVVEGAAVSTRMVRDHGRIVRMAHVLGSEAAEGAVRLGAVNRLPFKAQSQILDRCLVDGVWVVVTRVLDDFVDFDRWVASNAEGKPETESSDVLGSRIGDKLGEPPRPPIPGPTTDQPRSAPQPPPPKPSGPAAPRPTEVFGPEMGAQLAAVSPVTSPPPAARKSEPKPAPSRPASPVARPTPAAERRARPRVFWRDAPPAAPVAAPMIDAPKVVTLPPPKVDPMSISNVAGPTLKPAEPPPPAFNYPEPRHTYQLNPHDTAPKPPVQPPNTILSSPGIRRPRTSAGAGFTAVITGRPQGELGEAPSSGGAAPGQDQGGATFPKWLIITMIVVAVLAVVLIVISFLT